MSMKYPYRDLGVPFDRNFRNDLNANFDDIEHDIRMIGGEAAQQALEAAEEANTQAIYAQTSGDYANDKGDYAAQQGDYAQTQGNFANEKGLYAQQQGDYAKAQGDYAKQVGDENKTRWLNPVATFADIATTYPNPQHGDTVMVTDDGENSGSVYRYENGQWNLTQKHNDLAIADVQNKIGILNKKTYGIVNVKEFGAKGDGVADDTAAIQAAIDDAISKGVRKVFIPDGLYLVEGLVIKSNLQLIGNSMDRTILQLKPESTKDILISENFDTLTGTGSSDGVSGVRIANLKLDGNRGRCPQGGWCLKKYGYRWKLENVLVYRGNAGGIYSEWGATGGVGTDGDYMEDELINVRVWDCLNYGIQWRGTNDARFVDILVYLIRGYGIKFETKNGEYSAHGVMLNNVHVYACKGANGYGIWSNGTLFGTNVESESNDQSGIVLNGASHNLSNVMTFKNLKNGVEIIAPDTANTGFTAYDTKSTISSLLTYGNTEKGLVIRCQNTTINGVTAHTNSGGGVSLEASDCIVSDINSYGNTGNGITIGTQTTSVSGCSISGRSINNSDNQLNVVNDLGKCKYDLFLYSNVGQNDVSGTINSKSLYRLVKSISESNVGRVLKMFNSNGTAYGFELTSSGYLSLQGIYSQSLTPLNGWTSTGGITVYRDVAGKIHLQGFVSGGTITDGTIICTLPESYRPNQQVDTVATALDSSSVPIRPCRLQITTSGDVKVYGAPAGTNRIFLTGVSFF